jgi:hypothetical protein
MVASVNYTGRMVDLFIFQGAKLKGEQLILPGFDGDSGGKVTSGIQKLAQTWAILFLTELGSIQYDPEVGSSFVANFRMGLIRDESDVQTEFILAAAQVADQLALVTQLATVPPPNDEILSSAVLSRFTVDSNTGTLALYVRLTSQAGTTHDILVPISVAIQ